MDAEVLKSYLISLGFDINQPQLTKFNSTLKRAGDTIEQVTGGMAKAAVATGFAVVGAFTAIGTAAIGMMDNVAQADLSFQIFARRMFLNTDAARHMKIALDALGVSAEDVIWGPPELAQRFKALDELQNRIEKGFGGTQNIENRLRQFRDITFKFTELQVAMSLLARGATASLVDRLFGNGQAQAKLQQWLDWVINNVPRLSNEFADALAPTLKNTYEILKDLVGIGKDVTGFFLTFAGAIYGDNKLEQGEVNLRNIGKALEYVSGSIKKATDKVKELTDLIDAHPYIASMFGGAGIGAAVGSALPGVGTGAGAAAGALLGPTAVFGNHIGAFDSDETEKNARWNRWFGWTGLTSDVVSGAAGSDKYRALAAQISGVTGIPASLVYGQFAHETGNFTNRGARDLNNLAGIEMPGGGSYRSFASLDDFAQYYENLMRSSRYRGALGAKTPEDFAAALKSGGYYEDKESNYAAGVRRGAAVYDSGGGAGSTMNVGGVTVNITQPNASPAEIQQAVMAALEENMRKQRQRTTLDLSGAYH